MPSPHKIQNILSLNCLSSLFLLVYRWVLKDCFFVLTQHSKPVTVFNFIIEKRKKLMLLQTMLTHLCQSVNNIIIKYNN